MFFYASKVIWNVLQPSTLLFILLLGGLLLYWFGRKRAGIRVILVMTLIYGIVGLSSLPNAVLLTLEKRYDKPSLEQIGRVDGIIILGGVIDALLSQERGEIALNEAAERVTEPAMLARRFPQARLVFTGGDGSIIFEGKDEAGAAERFFTRLGIDADRLLIETKSRNTWENAAFTRRLVAPDPDERWLLVTSAFHMHRASGVFRAAGFDVIPYPVDFRTRGYADLWRNAPSISDAWRRVDLGTREWVGYMAYWATGRLE